MENPKEAFIIEEVNAISTTLQTRVGKAPVNGSYLPRTRIDQPYAPQSYTIEQIEQLSIPPQRSR